MVRVDSVNWVEMIRDGGSFCVSFQDPACVEHKLWFPIALRQSTRAGHGEPFVARVVRSSEENRVGWRFEDARPLTWAEALSLLEEIRPLISQTDEWGLRRFGEMVGVAKRAGRPSDGQ